MEDFGGGGSSIFGACAMSNRIPSAVDPRLISDDRPLAPVPGRLSPVPGRLPPVPGRKNESSPRKSEGGGGFWKGSHARSSDNTGLNFSAFCGAGAWSAFRAAASKACCLSIAPVWTSTSELDSARHRADAATGTASRRWRRISRHRAGAVARTSHRADAATETTSRRWRRAPEF